MSDDSLGVKDGRSNPKVSLIVELIMPLRFTIILCIGENIYGNAAAIIDWY